MDLRIEPSSKTPVSTQLRDRIAAAIGGGRLLPGDRLPTVRALAEELGLAANTVARAYRELESAGWIVGRGRRGTFVADTLPSAPDEAEARLAAAADRFARRARQLGFGSARALGEIRRAVREHGSRAGGRSPG
ncbi:MAG TPA: GntR family transcriptional regulator [Actinomycetota bacterium]